MDKIENLQQFEEAVQRVEELLPLINDDMPTGDPNYIEFVRLSNLVADYDEVHFSLCRSFDEVLDAKYGKIGTPEREQFRKEVEAYRQAIEEVDKKLDNLVEAITNGIYSSKTKQVLDELEERKKNLQEELYQEELDHPIVSEEQILHALYHYKNLDISTKEGKQRLIDGFVNSIYLYDDRYVITFNYKNKSKTVTFEEIESSSLTSKASPKTSIFKQKTA